MHNTKKISGMAYCCGIFAKSLSNPSIHDSLNLEENTAPAVIRIYSASDDDIDSLKNMILNRGGEPVESFPLIPAILIFSDATQSLNRSDEPAIDEWDLKSELKAMKAKFKADNFDILDEEIHARNCASCFDIPASENLKYENNLEMLVKEVESLDIRINESFERQRLNFLNLEELLIEIIQFQQRHSLSPSVHQTQRYYILSFPPLNSPDSGLIDQSVLEVSFSSEAIYLDGEEILIRLDSSRKLKE